jgi:hypothetical protein
MQPVAASFRRSTLHHITVGSMMFHAPSPRRPSSFTRIFSTSWQQQRATLDCPPPAPSASSFLPERFTYIDKTLLLAKIMSGPDQYVFAPAPRRMGKSLTVKMLGALARGERDKFEGMAIAAKHGLYDFDKQQYSVVQLDCSGLFVDTHSLGGASSSSSSSSDLVRVTADIDALTLKIDTLEQQIETEQDADKEQQLRDKEKQLRDKEKQLRDKEMFLLKLPDSGTSPQVKGVWANLAKRICAVALREHDFDISDQLDPADSMEALIDCLRRRHPDRMIVLTIDEYDAPVNAFLPHDPALAVEMATTLAPFYTMLKRRTDDLHKMFVTGVTKFSMTSMFSGPNQITPIMERTAEYSNLFGFTRAQVQDAYGDYMIERGFTTHAGLGASLDKLVRHYNGYRFHPEQADHDRSINPFSIMNFLLSGNVKNYWCGTAVGLSTVHMLGLRSFDILDGFTMTESELFRPIGAGEYASHWQQTAFVSGYATILSAKHFVNEGESDHHLTLGAPNEEVSKWLTEGAVSSLIGDMYGDIKVLDKYGAALQSLDWATAFDEHGQTLVNPRVQIHAIANEDQMKRVLATLLRRSGASSDSSIRRRVHGAEVSTRH